jgi:hypothetical protein
MRLKSFFVLLLVLAFTASAFAEEPESAAESLEKLRAQLFEVQTKEEDLRARVQQLEESLKPENIERSLAGVGSTKPEELREARRRQLTIERDNVLAQLRIVEQNRQRLEAAIAKAEVAAYHESARPTPETQMMVVSSISNYRWFLFGGGGFAALALAGGVLFYRRRIKLR